ncbi:oocyte-secreted protein 3 [Trichosurus vulpecula]|uniref:oocyte-secreted protein 3 n=1 Tax=Trichosurus vulpecula TaxID=9337 RepID=UPI00186ACEA3|nr:oocyte-secreted protein 3 [Trichosurus vulpecula]
MKLFALLVTLFLFFSKALHQDYPVWVTCGPDYFQVIMDRDLFRNGILLNPDQVTLGQDCQVSTVLEDKFFFFYSVLHCGIQREMKWNMVIFHSILHCHSLENVDGGAHDIPLKCTLEEETLNRPAIENFPPPSVGVSGMNVSDTPPSASWTQQDVGPREEGASGQQDPGAAALARHTFPVPTLSVASPVSWGQETCHQGSNSIPPYAASGFPWSTGSWALGTTYPLGNYK